MGSIEEPIVELDVLLVGAGFGSFTLMNRLRKQGLNVKIYEKGSASGGIWYWNCYPGARVDSDTPIYQLFDRELWEDFTFKERYAGGPELRRYFEYIEQKWDLKKDITYNKHVDGATFDEKTHKWLVDCSDGSQTLCKWFIPCIGFASKKFTPPFRGLSDFKGEVYHTAVWPQHGVSFKGKRVAQVGTGASGIQCIQEIGPKAKHLTIYQRTPNMCLPMNQRKLDPKEEEEKKKNGTYEKNFAKTYTTFAGFLYDFQKRNTFDDTPEEREKFFHNLMVEEGGFRFWLNTYKDMLFDEKANAEAYEFWKKTVRKRIPDPKKAELLAPTKAPHPWGTKRPSLEQNFYEVVSMDHVDIIDVNEDKIIEVTEKGIKTESGIVEVDVLVLATGFDSVTGSLAQLNIQGTGGGTIADHWANGTRTAMGIAIQEFPNMFFLYGPQAPTAFSNGPSCTAVQADWVEKTIKDLEANKVTRFEAKESTEEDWCRRMKEEWDATLFPQAKSWYQGANIPNRRFDIPRQSSGDSLAMARKRAPSNASEHSSTAARDQELGSMYDYLAKIILLGPSGCGKSCVLHRFLKNEWRILSSQTIGVEFASKIVKVGTGSRRKRVKLQLWDTAGTERFRSVSRSYYRGAAGALLIYDLCSRHSFHSLPTFLNDARALASPNLITVLVGNKLDLTEGDFEVPEPSLLDSPVVTPSASFTNRPDESRGSISSSKSTSLGSRNTATVAPEGREVSEEEAAHWASTRGIPVSMEVSALNGENVDEAFSRLAKIILTKIELGEINPDDPQSGIQYGDSGGWSGGISDGASVRSVDGARRRRRRSKRGGALRDWEEVFRLDSRGRRCC
ncbi:hypothetical protein FKW77_004242 [Venturia effusa]|uniref:FAD/NAD(P)-binding domain-containing protein n=1 Tax=Venturia effusa TaxID=50376 RepID=A0A517L5B5_9PEZI|nr:hypothetical protein FKW77_004242 [Venturia effusa]